MKFAVERIDHVEVFVRDIDSSIRWYGEVLGLREIFRFDPQPVMIGAGDTKLALFQAPANPQLLPNEQARRTLCWYLVAWRTDRVVFEAAQQHLAKLGIKFKGPVAHEVSQSIYFEDLDGHPLEITCYD